MRKAGEVWQACSKQSIEIKEANRETSTWQLDRLVPIGSQLVDNATLQTDERIYQCQKVLRAQANVVIEVLACTQYAGNDAISVADQMAAKVTKLAT